MSRPFQYGRQPRGWLPTQLRSFLYRRREANRPDLSLLSVNLPYGVVRRQDGDGRPAPSEDLSAYQVVHVGDLVMNQLGKPHGALGVSAYAGIISPAYFVAAIRATAAPRFVHHMLRTRLYISEYERRGKFMPPSQFDISWDQFRSIPALMPPLARQQEIAEFVDAELARIDNVIAAKHRLLELLDEFERAWTLNLRCNPDATIGASEMWLSYSLKTPDLSSTSASEAPQGDDDDDVKSDGAPGRTSDTTDRDAKLREFDLLVAKLRTPLRQQIDLLVERRQATAIAAVTGEADCRVDSRSG